MHRDFAQQCNILTLAECTMRVRMAVATFTAEARFHDVKLLLSDLYINQIRDTIESFCADRSCCTRHHGKG